jgi:hypothetical protein
VKHAWLLSLLLALSAACSDDEPGAAPTETACAEAAERTGELACLHVVTSEAEWQSVSVPMEAVDQVRSTKYMVPARPSARLPALLLNSSRYELHYDFLVTAFADSFPSLTPKQYLQLLFDAEQREFLVGAVTEYRTAEADKRWGFTVAGDPQQPGFVTCDDVRRAQRELQPRLPGGALWVVPSDKEQLTSFRDCGVPFLDPTAVKYEAYHRAAAFGTVRRFRATELNAAIERAEVGFRDILALEEAPSDIETVVSGIVTGTRQGPLSHVAVRSASRGTPNCYLEDAYGYLESWSDKLVRLECTQQGLLVREASLEEAEAYWQQLRPEPVAILEPERDYEELVDLEQLPLTTAAERARGIARFGAKGRNLAWLRQNMEPAFTPRGFLIPVAHYLHFVENSSWQVDLGDGLASHTFAETLAAWHADPTFAADGALRRERLLALQDAFEAASCDQALLDALGQRLVATFGDAAVTVRFRSSSNAEDGAFFNGAGLYDSYSGCWADDLDADDLGPSLCDPGEAKERGVCRALRKVWASLFNPKAYDERAFYGIDPARLAMGVLVNERSDAERANMVAFSGNPSARSDTRYLVSAQIDELPVVSPEPGMWPEQVLLTLEDGAVAQIERVTGSSELPDGTPVLQDAELELLGRELARLVGIYPHDAEPPAGHSLLLDTEWKLMPDGSLRIKQVRPFLN